MESHTVIQNKASKIAPFLSKIAPVYGIQQNFTSFWKESIIFTCPPLFLPVLDRRTVYNFQPCSLVIFALDQLKLEVASPNTSLLPDSWDLQMCTQL